MIIALVLFGATIYGSMRHHGWPGWGFVTAFIAGMMFEMNLSQFQYPLTWEPGIWWRIGGLALGAAVALIYVRRKKGMS